MNSFINRNVTIFLLKFLGVFAASVLSKFEYETGKARSLFVLFDPFHATGLFLCPLKTSENSGYNEKEGEKH